MPSITSRLLFFRLREVFAPEDPMSVPLLRLMAASNDARLLTKLMIAAHEDIADLNESENLILNGELGYLLRMLCSHLYEAGTAVRDLDAKCHDRINAMLEEGRGRDAFERIRKIYQDNSDTGFNKRVLQPIRTLGAFHYKDRTFARGLATHPEVGKIVVAESSGMSRYAVTDMFASELLVDAVGRAREGFLNAVSIAIDLARSLGDAIDHLLLALFKHYQQSIVKTQSEPIRESAAHRRVRETRTELRTPTDRQ